MALKFIRMWKNHSNATAWFVEIRSTQLNNNNCCCEIVFKMRGPCACVAKDVEFRDREKRILRGVFHQSMSESGCNVQSQKQQAKNIIYLRGTFTKHEEISLWHAYTHTRISYLYVCANDDGKANISTCKTLNLLIDDSAPVRLNWSANVNVSVKGYATSTSTQYTYICIQITLRITI